MLSLEEVRKRKTAVTRKVTVVLDAEWGARFTELSDRAQELLGLGAMGTREYRDIEARLEAMAAEAPEHTIELHVRGVSTDRYERILALHPPTAEQRRVAKSRGESVRPWNPETFPAALLAACLVDPDTGEPWATEKELAALWTDDAWNVADLVGLFETALDVCLNRFTVPGQR